MLGYLNMEKETQEYFDDDGFARTGDLAKYDEEGNIVICGRLKDQIMYVHTMIEKSHNNAAIKKSLAFEGSATRDVLCT